jgi:site-specific recombinase XerD
LCNKSYTLNTFHIIKELKELIINPPDFLFVKKGSNILMGYTNYRKMIKEGLQKKFGPYSFKHTTIDKLIRQGCDIAAINKVARFHSSINTLQV